MTIDVQWCAYFAVEKGILSPELCLQIEQMFEGNCDLQTFCQTILDNGLCADMQLVQQIMNEAHANATTGAGPPQNYFSAGATAAAPAHTAPPQPQAAQAPPQPQPQAAPTPAPAAAASAVAGAASERTSAHGQMPGIENVEDMDDEQVRQLMINILYTARDIGASDFHISADFRPFARINLNIQSFGDTVASEVASQRLNTILLTEEQRKSFEETGDLDICLALDEANRFRVNLMKHKDGPAGTYRLIPNKVQTLEELGFKNPETIYKLLDFHNGLLLVTGPVGSGKTTTLAALVNAMNNKRYDHIITVENPIEIVQRSNNCNVTQREAGTHTNSFAAALKGALRQDPDIIVIGELRDLETIEMAITASETGHLVIGTLHTSDVGSTLNRLLDVFPPTQQPQIRSMVAESLKGIICQQLIPKIGGGMAVASEIMLSTTAVANNIRENKTHQLKQILETGSKQGMCLMDQSVWALYEEGVITEETAISKFVDKAFVNKIRNKQITQGAAAEAAAAEPAKKKRFGFR